MIPNLQRHSRHVLAITCAAMALACGAPAQAQAPAPGAHAAAPGVFAKVGDVLITREDYEAAFAQAARAKFYHGKPPEAEVAALQREVAQNMVDEILLAAEARRRKLQPDAAEVNKSIAAYEQRYRDSAQWKANRERLLPGIRAKLERDSVVEQLTRQAKTVADPTPQELQAYYEQHKDKFTSPEQVHVAVILLKVDPASPKQKWVSALAEGAALAKQLRAGGNFAEQARKLSGDESAAKGGDMGYVHRGMLAQPAQEAIDKIKPGELTDAVELLQGVAVFKLLGRKPPQLNPLDVVRPRARDLLMRDRSDAAWTAFLARLRRETPVKIDESGFLPLPLAAKAAETAAARR